MHITPHFILLYKRALVKSRACEKEKSADALFFHNKEEHCLKLQAVLLCKFNEGCVVLKAVRMVGATGLADRFDNATV